MGCFLFGNLCFQMGITVMGFAEHFGHYVTYFFQVKDSPNFSTMEIKVPPTPSIIYVKSFSHCLTVKELLTSNGSK